MFNAIVLAAALAAQPTIKLETDGAGQWSFHVTGNGSDAFTVRVETAGELPPLLGTLRSEGGEQFFKPRFPLQAGLRYRAVLASAPPVTEVFAIPASTAAAPISVLQVYPEAEQLPENQLKFYIQFSGSMSRGDAYRWIHLLDEQDQEVPLAFLQLNEELWDPEYQRFTLYFDPGRVKSDLLPGREMGAPLHAGRKYSLLVDASWPDAQGRSLTAAYRKEFTVVTADHVAPDTAQWRVTAPTTSRAPVMIEFPEMLDHALLSRMIAVLDAQGHEVQGAVQVDRNDTRWQFTPAADWSAGQYSLRVNTALEDLAGNKIGRLFEVVDEKDVLQRARAAFVILPLRIDATRSK